MMKTKTIFSCQICGYQSIKWLGRCPECNQWNSFIEEPGLKSGANVPVSLDGKPTRLSDILVSEKQRILTGIKEFDRVLGGGLVAGSVVLVGGEPGIGKSTLLLQASNSLANNFIDTLYVSGEESLSQIKLHSERLNINCNSLYLLNEINLESIKAQIEKLSPKVVIIDSVQVIYNPIINSSSGSISQVRECAGELVVLAKSKNITLILIGHVTKEGSIAGPKVLEHLVDTVLYFEGERFTDFRLLRAVKNRFGSTNEVGIFDMAANGLREVTNPSELFITKHRENRYGSVIVPVMQGTRPLLVEIQALISPANFGMPLRRTTGLDYNKLVLLVAVLEKHIGLGLSSQEIFVNVAGGIKVQEPSCDLAVVIAIVSNFKEKAIDEHMVVLGEVGLLGEVRAVSNIHARLLESHRLGFKKAIVPNENLKDKNIKGIGLEIIGVDTLKDALNIIFK